MGCACKNCGGIFKKFKSEKKVFCGTKCRGNYLSKERSPHFNMVKHNCFECNKVFLIHPYKLKTKVNRFCSKECRILGFSKSHKLSGNPNWKGGITPGYKKIQVSDKYSTWRNDCYKRDSFTCQICGDKSGGNLNVHHKKHFKVLINEAKIYNSGVSWYNACLSYEPLWDILNGITVCKECHKKIHAKV